MADVPSAYGGDRVEREVSDEDSKPAENDPLQIGEKTKTPVQRRVQRPLPGRGAPRPEPGERKPLIEQFGRSMHPVALDAASRELDGQRHTVKPAAHAGDDGRLIVAEIQLCAARASPLDEELDRRKCPDDFGRQLRAVGRTGQRVQPVDVLSVRLERFTTRRRECEYWARP